MKKPIKQKNILNSKRIFLTLDMILLELSDLAHYIIHLVAIQYMGIYYLKVQNMCLMDIEKHIAEH